MEIKRCYDTIIGASVGENQLVRKRTNPTVTDGDNSIAIADGKVTITVNGSGTPIAPVDWIVLQKNHKYLILTNVPFSIGYLLYFARYAPAITGCGYIINYIGDTGQNTLRCYIASSAVAGTYEVYPQCIDLTAMLGSTIADYLYNLETATAGAGIAKLRSWGFLRGYQAFNAGSIESVEVTEKKCVGFNQWDEEWEVGQYSPATGEKGTRADAIRCKNMIPVMPNTAYYFHCGSHPATADGVWLWYGIDGDYIGYITGKLNREQTSPSDAYFMTFYVAPETAYNHDICINISSDRNGEYEPYSANTYDLGTDTLRGLFKLDSNNNLYADGDTKTSDGTVTRKYGVVDLGTLNWNKATWNFNTAGIASSVKKPQNNSELIGFVCGKNMIPKTGNEISATAGTYEAYIGTNGNFYWAYPIDAYADAATFKTAMSGVLLVYELATPTTETSTPFQNPQICNPDGTEEYITETGVPVGHETRYQL